MPTKFEISVAIPAYNRAEYLEETLESVLNQTYPPSEIVVVDDGSTDETPEILTRYGDRIKTTRIENSGSANARRKAVELGSCPWISFCDSDDIWLPNHLETHVKFLQKHPQVNFTFSDLIPFGPNSIPGRTYFSDAPHGWQESLGNPDEDNFLVLGEKAYELFLAFNPASPVTTVMSRELYESIGGINPSYSRMTAEDSDMARRAALKGTAAICLNPTAKQRRHLGNKSGQITKTILGKITILQDHLDNRITPDHLREKVLSTINNAKKEAFYAAFYARDYPTTQKVFDDLPTGLRTPHMLIRLCYLRVLSFFKK
jgi:glycosyltransferase involved in cell wall biosynthesis